jgi:hypothetical protein
LPSGVAAQCCCSWRHTGSCESCRCMPGRCKLSAWDLPGANAAVVRLPNECHMA